MQAKKKPRTDPSGEGGMMPLTGHLKELRNRIIVCIVVLLSVCVIALIFAQPIINALLAKGTQFGYEFVILAPQELMMQQFKISLLAGACVTVPVVLYELWAFMRPGLKEKESRYFLFGIVFGLICFVIGVLFAFEVTWPAMLYFFDSLITDNITNSVSVQYYIDFALLVFVIFGCVFEMPMLAMLLSQLGILTPQLMKKIRGGAIVAIFLIAAFITPTDIFSQLIVAVPMCVLYEVSIFLCSIFYRNKKKKETEGVDGGADEDDEDKTGESADK